MTPVRRGIIDSASIVLGVVPFALILGATVARSSIGNAVGWASSPLMFAGASQLAAIELIAGGATAVAVVGTALVINLRHVMYSGSIAPWFRDAPLPFMVVAPYFLTDPVYVLAAMRFPELPDSRSRRRYYLAVGLCLFVGWSAATAAGILLGRFLPDSSAFTMVVPLTFLAMLVPSVADRPTLLAALVAGTISVAAHGLPLQLGLPAGAVSGTLVGIVADPDITGKRKWANRSSQGA